MRPKIGVTYTHSHPLPAHLTCLSNTVALWPNPVPGKWKIPQPNIRADTFQNAAHLFMPSQRYLGSTGSRKARLAATIHDQRHGESSHPTDSSYRQEMGSILN